MATPESKIEEFKAVGASIAEPIIGAMAPPPLETLVNAFAVAHGGESQLFQTNLVRQVWAGIIDPSQMSIRVNGVDAAALAAQVQASEAKRASTLSMLYGVPLLLILLHISFSIGLLTGLFRSGKAANDRV